MKSESELLKEFNELVLQAESQTGKERDNSFKKAQAAAFEINHRQIKKFKKDNPNPQGNYPIHTKDTISRLALLVTIWKNCIYFTDVAAFMPIAKDTMYNHEIHKSDTLKDAISYNKIKTKHAMRGKWFRSENATLQVALYKLLADSDELQRLTMNNINVDTGLFDDMDKNDLEKEFFLRSGKSEVDEPALSDLDE